VGLVPVGGAGRECASRVGIGQHVDAPSGEGPDHRKISMRRRDPKGLARRTTPMPSAGKSPSTVLPFIHVPSSASSGWIRLGGAECLPSTMVPGWPWILLIGFHVPSRRCLVRHRTGTGPLQPSTERGFPPPVRPDRGATRHRVGLLYSADGPTQRVSRWNDCGRDDAARRIGS